MPAERLCSAEGCDKPAFRRSYCSMHYSRLLRHGDPSIKSKPKVMTEKRCSVNGCSNPHYGKGWCKKHYLRWYSGYDVEKSQTEKNQDFISGILKSETDECILWPKAPLQQSGYGRITINGKSQPIHRVICQLAHGDPPSPDHQAAHNCGVRLCINPRHLRWSTAKDNIADRVLHGTDWRGEKHPNALLTDDLVREIRSLRGELKRSEIARRLNISIHVVKDVLYGRSWKHIK